MDTESAELDMNTLIKTEEDTPGARILAYRKAAGLAQRQLALICDPPMDFTAIGRIERNQGYTGASLNRLAKALNCKVSDFFLPAELAAWPRVREDTRSAVKVMIRNDIEAAGQH